MTCHASTTDVHNMRTNALVLLLLGVVWVEAAAPSGPGVVAPAGPCRLSEATCTSANSRHRCIPLTRVCDGVDDCGDGSDEPRFCSPCNRTYYGDLGKTYQLAVHRPREDRLPFICELTFHAPGGSYGDFVQLTFDSFTLGRFTSWTKSGCPDGDLQIWESAAERPQVGGRWCGTAWGPPALYYSETSNVTLHLRLSRMPTGGHGNAIPLGSGSSASMGFNFDFSLGFKVLSRESAVVRYGGRVNASAGPQLSHPETKYYLGDLIPGTYCSRLYSDCDKKLCRLQSPNFPGVYPRNVTCYYAVRQHVVPPGTHALISVSQPSGQMVSIRSRGTLPGSARSGETMIATGNAGRSSAHTVKVWKECDEVQDYVTVFDGYTTRDPVLMRFCGGGQAVPAAVSSGPELLVEFTSSPFGTFLAPPAATEQGGQVAFQPGGLGGALHGFELQVEVKFVPIHTPTYMNNSCEFWIRQSTEPLPNGRSDSGGRLENPSHSLAPNTTCVYHISASEGTSKVWVSMLRFLVTSALDPTYQDEKCSAELRIWDGDLTHVAVSQNCDSGPGCERPRSPMLDSSHRMLGRNASLLAYYCKDLSDRSCEHALLANASRSPRPCRPGRGAEGFVSSGASITVELRVSESTALRPVRFAALYEFVDPRQDGEHLGPGPCDRRFSSRGRPGPAPGLLPFRDLRDNTFRSPKDIFLYGRGGAKNLKCRYRFEAEPGERVKLTITRLLTGPGPPTCHSVLDPVLGRHRCVGGNYTARIVVHEVPWPQQQKDGGKDGGSVLVPRECACSPDAAPLVYVSTGTAVELVLEARDMAANVDYDDILLEGRFEFLATPACTRNRKVTGPSGEIRVKSPSGSRDEVHCENYPWLLEPGPGKFLYVKIRGHLVPDPTPAGHNTSETSNVVTTSPQCLTKNRLVVYSSGELRATVCPMSPQRTATVEVFSTGWEEVTMPVGRNTSVAPQDERKRRLVVEFVAREPGSYSVSWLEVEPLRKQQGPAVLPPAGYIMIGEKGDPNDIRPLDHCPHRCPELSACINASLFCDGIDHCPSGYDEANEFCAPYFLRLPQLLYVALASAGLFALCAALFVGGFRGCRDCRDRCHRRRKQSRMKLLLPPGSAGKDLAIS